MERGQPQPVLVRWDDAVEQWIIIDGEPFWRAAVQADLKTIIAVEATRPFADNGSPEGQFIENRVCEDHIQAAVNADDVGPGESYQLSKVEEREPPARGSEGGVMGSTSIENQPATVFGRNVPGSMDAQPTGAISMDDLQKVEESLRKGLKRRIAKRAEERLETAEPDEAWRTAYRRVYVENETSSEVACDFSEIPYEQFCVRLEGVHKRFCEALREDFPGLKDDLSSPRERRKGGPMADLT